MYRPYDNNNNFRSIMQKVSDVKNGVEPLFIIFDGIVDFVGNISISYLMIFYSGLFRGMTIVFILLITKSETVLNKKIN